jgi:structural maintenance of chromosome 3 (chondroitin sulfate proteoglycan 6)
LSEEEEREIGQLQRALTENIDRIRNASEARLNIETQVNKLRTMLDTNLEKRATELESFLRSVAISGEELNLQTRQEELATLNTRLAQLRRELESSSSKVTELSKSIKAKQDELEALRQQEVNYRAEMNERSRNMEKLVEKRSLYLAKKEECARKVRELGSLPPDAFDKYTNKNVKQLLAALERVSDKLKKYKNVNKKALDQYTSFTEQREELRIRKDELDNGRESILQLIADLDQKKDEAVDRTFKQIASNFSKTFSTLVPGGKGNLVILETSRRGENMDDSEEEDEETSGPIRYSGISVNVSFPFGVSSTHQLSGGQESVVALSLIFAIQRCDPSPFYVFDEIDSALDPVHRKAVATMIASQAGNTQFIMTTFHPELLVHADKFYGVVFQNKVSKISEITNDDARMLVEDQEHEQKEDF